MGERLLKTHLKINLFECDARNLSKKSENLMQVLSNEEIRSVKKDKTVYVCLPIELFVH